MFSGEESVRFDSDKSAAQVDELIEDALAGLGDTRISKRGQIDIRPRGSFNTQWTLTTMRGNVRQRKNGEYEVSVNYTCTLTGLGWAVCIVGFIFFLVGPLILLAPYNMKALISRRARDAVRDLEDDA
jgi:hypothetical protein